MHIYIWSRLVYRWACISMPWVYARKSWFKWFELVFVKEASLYFTYCGHECQRREIIIASAKCEAERRYHYCKWGRHIQNLIPSLNKRLGLNTLKVNWLKWHSMGGYLPITADNAWTPNLTHRLEFYLLKLSFPSTLRKLWTVSCRADISIVAVSSIRFVADVHSIVEVILSVDLTLL